MFDRENLIHLVPPSLPQPRCYQAFAFGYGYVGLRKGTPAYEHLVPRHQSNPNWGGHSGGIFALGLTSLWAISRRNLACAKIRFLYLSALGQSTYIHLTYMHEVSKVKERRLGMLSSQESTPLPIWPPSSCKWMQRQSSIWVRLDIWRIEPHGQTQILGKNSWWWSDLILM